MLRATFATLIAVAGLSVSAAEPPIYRMDFQNAEVGKVPEGMLVLDGGFAVKEDSGGRCLELPGAPLDTYGVLFGPTETNNVSVTARLYGTAKGRRYPAFAVGLGGVNGFKLRVSPGKNELELLKGDTDLTSVPFKWTSGKWLHLRLQIRQSEANAWKVEGKVWLDGQPEPAAWLIALDEKQAPRPGRAAIWGAPYAGTPIRYDDLVVTKVGTAP